MAARLTLIPFCALLIGGCAPASDAAAGDNVAAVGERVTDQAVLGGGPAELIARGEACLLRRAGHSDLPLAPAPPCRFLRVDGAVQQYGYPDRGIHAVVLVIGTAADASRKAHFGASSTMACGTVAHGLIVRGKAVTAARRPQRGGLYCVDQGRDEKDFAAAAQDG